VRGGYEHHTDLDDLLDRAATLSVRTMIVDVEPLVSWWDSRQDSLDWGLAMIVAKASTVPTLRVLVFATNSVRRPSSVPAGPDIEVSYVAAAGKPLRARRFRQLPRPGAVAGDQVATDGLLARRLGFTFLHYQPPMADVPIGPRILHGLGRLVLPLLFRRLGQADSRFSLLPYAHSPHNATTSIAMIISDQNG
jgi:predicted HAD superfamily phosphohydrolase YqeG